MARAEATPFRRALPLLAVSLVNKVASVGVSLLPVLVVERALPPGEAAFVLGAARAAAVLGTVGGGLLADRFGGKVALLVSFGTAAAGVAGMAVPGDTALLVTTAGVANAGVAMFPVASRLLLAAAVPGAEQKEAVAWLRTVANLGLAVSFTISGLLGGERLVLLLLLDATVSVAALALGAAWLPAREPAEAGPAAGAGRWPTFLAMTLLVACWNGAYEAYLTAGAAVLRTTLGPDGVRVFSVVMVANTVGCTALGVAVTRGVGRPDRTVPAGFALLLVGAVVGTGGDAVGALVGVTIVTVGELLWAATAQLVWMGLIPAGPRRSTTFAVAMAVAFLARAAGAAAVFPVVLASPSPRAAMGLLVLPGLLLSSLAGPIWADFRQVGAGR